MGLVERTRWQLDTPLSAKTVVDALIDFSPRREVIWKETCDPAVYRVHALGHAWAEVTEGVWYAWSCERYDGSVPEVLSLTQLDSNIADPGRHDSLHDRAATGGWGADRMRALPRLSRPPRKGAGHVHGALRVGHPAAPVPGVDGPSGWRLLN